MMTRIIMKNFAIQIDRHGVDMVRMPDAWNGFKDAGPRPTGRQPSPQRQDSSIREDEP